MDTYEAEHFGRPIETTSQVIIDKSHYLLIGDRRLRMREIASAVSISSEWLYTIEYQY